jgi:hypothetical protein
VVWILPLLALRAAPAWLALAVLAPLGYVPLVLASAGGEWREPIWTRALVHGAAWALLFAKGLTPREGPVISDDS